MFFLIFKQFFDVLPRAHTKKFSGARQHDDKKKSVNKFCCYDQKQQPPFFSHLFFLLLLVVATKKCCQNVAQQKKTFLFRKFFSKILSNVSSDPCHRGGGNADTNYVFASYMMQIHSSYQNYPPL